MGTFSKALASSGAFLASSKEVTNYLHYFGRAYVFSTALPPHTLATVLASLDVVESEPELRHQLWKNVHYVYENLKTLGFKLGPFPSPIIMIIIGDEVKMRKMSRMIHDQGLFINAVPYPAVAKDQCRLRISLMATHTQQDLDQAIEIIEKVSRQFGII
jgi:glycine C-acetyltransferase